MTSRRKMRKGYTTGACVQAAARAAALSLLSESVPCHTPDEEGMLEDREAGGPVEIALPNGENASFMVTMHAQGVCSVIKDAGDDPDVTDGIQIFVCVIPRTDGKIHVDGAEGVGRVTLEGLPVKVGKAAINPVPLKYIRSEVKAVLNQGAEVMVSIPAGEELAARTFNPRLGIEGGISILGTTGRVEPWSAAAYQESLILQLDVARAAGVREPLLVPGAKGERAALKHGYKPEAIIQVGNFFGMMIKAAGERGYTRVKVMGHASKISKMARGDFDTHSRRSEMPLDILADCAREAAGWSRSRARALQEMPTTEAAVGRLVSEGAAEALGEAARRSSAALKNEFGIEAEAILTDGSGNIVGRG